MENAAKKEINTDENVSAEALSDRAVVVQDQFGDDDSWLDEELSDEELAALGEEDFYDEEFLKEELERLEAQDRVLDEIADDQEVSDHATAAAPLEMDMALEATPPALQSTSGDEALLPEEPPVAYEQAPASAYVEDRPGELDAFDAPAVETTSAAIVTSDAAPDLDEDEGYDAEVGEYHDEEVTHRPVPRISIHAFCETPATTEILEDASKDRRLSKAHLTMHMGGLPKAVEYFQSAATPNLLILETVDAGGELFNQLAALAEVCDPSTKVIIVGRVNDIGLYRELMNQGVSDYLVRPKSPLKLIQSISDIYVDPSAPPIGRTIAFVGARGGVGSSTIAHNVAWCSAEEMETDTVVLDLDLPFGTASLDFEQDPTSGLLEALTMPERLDDVLLDRLLQKHTDRLSLFTAPNLLDRDYDLPDYAFEAVIDVVRAAAPTIVIDVPHIWTGWARHLLQTADEIVVTATPDLASFRNAKSIVDVVAAARPNDAAPILVLNQFDPKVSSVPVEQFVEHIGLRPALTVAWEPRLFHAAATNAASILEVGARTKTAQGLRDLTGLVLGRDAALAKPSAFDLSGLFKR